MSQHSVSRPALFSLLLMLFLAAIDTTILSTAMPRIVTLLGYPHLYHWAFTAFMLTSTLALPFYGKMADQIGIRRCILFAGMIFVLGSLICLLTPHMYGLIVGRAIQGLGASGLQSVTLIAFGMLFSAEERGARQSLISIVWGFSSLAGPISGGFLVSYLSWRWIFGLNVLLGIIALSIFSLTFPSQEKKDAQKIDFISAGLLMFGLSGFILLSGEKTSTLTSMAYILIAGILAAFIFRQQHTSQPLIPLQHFRISMYQRACLLGFLAFFMGFSALTYIPFYLQKVLLMAPEKAGLMMTPMMVTWPLASAIVGLNLNKLGFKRTAVFGCSNLCLGLLAWLLIALNYPLPWPALWCVFLGLGMGCLTPSLIVLVQTIVPFHEIGVASSTLVLLRNIGSTLGISLMGALQIQSQDTLSLQTSLALVFGFLLFFAVLNLSASLGMPNMSPAELKKAVIDP